MNGALTSKRREHTYFLDLLRIIACFFVIVNHTNSTIFQSRTPDSLTWYVSLTYFFVSKIAVPIFFMISGYLLLGKADTWRKTAGRVVRIAATLVVCAVIYSVYAYCKQTGERSLQTVWDAVIYVYAKSPSNALWYLYAYLGILLMLPFMQKLAIAMSKRDYHVFLLLSAFFVGIYPILIHYFPILTYNNRFYIPLFSGYVAMLFLGQYFARFGVKKTRIGFCLAAAGFAATVAFNVVATYYEYQKGGNYLFFDNRNLFPIVAGSVCVFYMSTFITLPQKVWRVISYIGSCTFGIYLISDLFIKVWKPQFAALCERMHPLPAVLLYELCVFITGLALTAILKKIPVIKKAL